MLPTLIMNILTDICIMLIPAPVVLQVRMGVMKKLSLLLLFSGGFFVMIAAILRVTYVMVVSLLIPGVDLGLAIFIDIL